MKRFPLFPLLTAMAAGQELRQVDLPATVRGCFDTLRQRIVCPGQGNYSLEWDGGTWRRTPDRGFPSGFSANYCFHDAATDRLWVLQESELPTGPAFRVWNRVDSTWQDVTPVGGPTGIYLGGLAFDEATHEVVLFGGTDFNGQEHDETWTFDGAAWTQRSPAHVPPSRYYTAITYDAARNRVVMFGGLHNYSDLDDTWEWDGIDWTQITGASPPSRWGGSMAFDRARDVVVLGGGRGSQATSIWGYQDLWEFDGTTWAQRSGPPLAGAGAGAFVYDEARSETVMLRAYNAASSGKVWAWDGTSWNARLSLPEEPPWSFAFSAAPDAAGTAVLRFGGEMNLNPLDTALFEFDGSGWQALAQTGPPRRAGAVMWSQGGSTFVFSGQDPVSSVYRTDQWRWDGANWTQVFTTPMPNPRASRMAVMSNQNLAVMFGGFAGLALGDTWTFDGAGWQQLTAGPQPASRYQHAMAYDPTRDRVVMFGGSYFNGTSIVDLQDTWEFDGATWQQVALGSALTPPSTGIMAYDASLQRVVFAATENNAYSFWLFDGVQWAPLSVNGDKLSANPLRSYQPVAVTGPDGRFTAVDAHGVYSLLFAPASATGYGTRCSADAPYLSANQLPTLGAATLSLDVTLAPVNSFVAIAGSDQAVSVPVFGCDLLVAPIVVVLALTDARGTANLPLPIPNTPSLAGAPYFFQAVTPSPATPLGLTFSAGLRLDLGH